MPGNAAAFTFLTFYNMFTHRSLGPSDVNDILYDTEGAL